MKKWSLPCLVKNAVRRINNQTSVTRQGLDWTSNKTNGAGNEFRPGFWTVTVAQWPTLHQLLQTSSQSTLPHDMAAKEWSVFGKGLPEAVTLSLTNFSIFLNDRKMKTFDTKHSFGHLVQPDTQKSPFISLLRERARGSSAQLLLATEPQSNNYIGKFTINKKIF